MAVEPGAELDIDAVGGVREDIGAQDGQHSLEQRNDDHTGDHHVERAETLVHQHLVDDDLEDHRRYEGEDLQEERGDHHLGEHPPVFVDRAEEPGDVEALRQVDQRTAARHLHDRAAPSCLELFALEQRRPLGIRHLDQDPLGVSPGDEHEAAVLQLGNGRQRRLDEAFPRQRSLTRPEPEPLGGAQHLGRADRPGTELVQQLGAIDGDAVVAQQQHQARQPVIGRRGGRGGRVAHGNLTDVPRQTG